MIVSYVYLFLLLYYSGCRIVHVSHKRMDELLLRYYPYIHPKLDASLRAICSNWDELPILAHDIRTYTLWQFNIAHGKSPFIVDFPIRNGDFPVRKLLVITRG